jgi:hypothetical protein
MTIKSKSLKFKLPASLFNSSGLAIDQQERKADVRFKSVIVIIVMILALPSLAQADNLIGLGLGANMSSLTNQPSASTNVEFVAGAFFDYGLGDIWYVETGLRYNSYGITGPGFVNLTAGTVSSDVHYLEIPILIKPTFNLGGWYPYLLAGPQIGFKVSETASANNVSSSSSTSTNIYNSVNVMIVLGAGAEVPIGNVRLFGQFDYDLGLVNIVNSSTIVTSPIVGSAQTRGALFTAGVVIPLSREEPGPGSP